MNFLPSIAIHLIFHLDYIFEWKDEKERPPSRRNNHSQNSPLQLNWYIYLLVDLIWNVDHTMAVDLIEQLNISTSIGTYVRTCFYLEKRKLQFLCLFSESF